MACLDEIRTVLKYVIMLLCEQSVSGLCVKRTHCGGVQYLFRNRRAAPDYVKSSLFTYKMLMILTNKSSFQQCHV
jgi:hypothetical protein